MPRLNTRLAAGCVVLGLAAAGCGGSQSGSSTGQEKSGPSGSPSSATPSVKPTTPAEKTVAALLGRVMDRGTGHFAQTTSDISGTVLSSVTGRYSLEDKQLAATITAPGAAPPADARVDLVGAAAYLQAAQWKQPARGCWLRTRVKDLVSTYGLDFATTDDRPLGLSLLSEIRAGTDSGGGVISGTVPIRSVLPLLSGPLKDRLVKAQPAGSVEAVLTINGDNVALTVPGYALSSALGAALHIEESQLSSIAGSRYELTLRPASSVAEVRAPDLDKQMSPADLKANRCG